MIEHEFAFNFIRSNLDVDNVVSNWKQLIGLCDYLGYTQKSAYFKYNLVRAIYKRESDEKLQIIEDTLKSCKET
jgi:predicted xylose isomerase-like sugar epimerase